MQGFTAQIRFCIESSLIVLEDGIITGDLYIVFSLKMSSHEYNDMTKTNFVQSFHSCTLWSM